VQDAVFALDLSLRVEGRLAAANRYWFSRTENIRPLLDMGATTLDARREAAAEGWRLTVTNTGPQAALCVWLEDARPLGAEGYVYFSDNHFSLFPGEAHTINAEWDNVPGGERRLIMAGWNTPSVTVTA